MIDLHIHILPGVDDGPGTLDESIALARSVAADGTRVVAATPHVRDDYPTEPATMERLVAELRQVLEDRDVDLDVRPGGEIALGRLQQLGAEGVRRFGLGGSDRYLLVEFPYAGWPLDLGMQVAGLQRSGMTPVLAHPERNGDVQASPERLRPLVEAGARVQITAASVDGRLGPRAKAASFALLELRLAHLLASDAHAPSTRASGMSDALIALGDDEVARRLVRDAPSAVLAGELLPAEGPSLRRRRRFALPRFRR